MGNTLGKPPGPAGNPLIGPFGDFRRQPANFLLNVAREYGDISYFRLGLQRMFLLNRPDFVQEVLVTQAPSFKKSRILEKAKTLLGEGLLTSEGDFHLRQRRLAQPAFYRDRLTGYAQTMVDCSADAQARWTDGEPLDMAHQMMSLTLRIVGLTLFSRDVESEARSIGDALTDVISTFETMLLPFSGLLQRLPLPSIRRADKARQTLDRIIYQMIAERRASGEDRGDLLSMLLLAQDNEGSTGGMNDKQVRDEALTLFLAGHETTANALTWTWYLLSENPDAETRLHAEIDEVLGDRQPGYDDLPRLEYTERVLAESLRLYPPAWAIGRMALRQVRIYNYEIAPKSICIVSPYVMHRNPRHWPDPERFDPDRFTPEAKQARPRFAYFPFGGGPRVCIGERFAWMEGVLVLATIAQRWRFNLTPGQVVEPHPQITLRPRYGMRMVAQRRRV
jgi:cytochrome P450